GGSLCDLHDLREAPVLRLRQRARLDNADDVADLCLVLLVVGVELRRAPDDLLVLGMRLDGVHADDDRLVHRTRDDDAPALLAATALVLGLRQPRDRLALGRALTLRLHVLVALRARQPLALLFPLNLLRSLPLNLLRSFSGGGFSTGLCIVRFFRRRFLWR